MSRADDDVPEVLTEPPHGLADGTPVWPQSLLRHERIEVPGGRSIGIGEWGHAEGDPLLWFHGTPGAGLQVPPDAPSRAAERGYRLIVVERPGTGWSTPHLYDRVRDFSDDVDLLADALGLDRFAVAGLSGGGPYVLATAHDLRERVVSGAVLGGIGPTAGPEQAPGYTRLLPMWEPVLRAVRDPIAGVATDIVNRCAPYASPGFEVYKRIAPQSDRRVFDRPEMKQMFIHDIVTAAERGFRAPIYDLVLFGRPWGFSLRDVTVPITFWHGDADLIVPISHSEHQARLVPASRLVIKPGGGHFAGFTVIDEVLDSIDEAWPDRRGA